MIVLLENREDRAGLARLADQAEVDAGVATDRVVSPDRLANTSLAFTPAAHAGSHDPAGSDPLPGFVPSVWFRGQAVGFTGGALDYASLAQSAPGDFSISGAGDIIVNVSGVYLVVWTALNPGGGANSSFISFPGAGPTLATATQTGAAPAQANTSSGIIIGSGTLVVTAAGFFGTSPENSISITRIG